MIKINRRWGKDAFFKKEGHKTQLKKEVILTLLGALCTLLVLFNFGGTQSSKLKIDPPETTSEAKVYVDFDKIEIKVKNKMDEKNKPKKLRSNKKIGSLFSKMKVFERSFLSEIPDGAEVDAKLNLSVLPQTLVSAHLISSLTVDGEVVLPKNTEVFGMSQEIDSRMSIEFIKAVLPTGEKHKIKAFAHERKDTSFGLKGSQVGPRTITALASTGLYFVSGLSEGLIERQMTENQVSIKASMKNGLLNGASKASMEQSRQILSDLKNKQSVLRVKKGKKFKLIFYSME